MQKWTLIEFSKIIPYRFTMKVETKQILLVIILIALSLKINASPTQNEKNPPLNTPLGTGVEKFLNLAKLTKGKES